MFDTDTKDSGQAVGDRLDRPIGAIYLNELRRYLSSVAHRQFRRLDKADVDQYVLTLIFKVAPPSDDCSWEPSFWERISLGRPDDHIDLLPDSDESRKYHELFPHHTLLVEGTKNIRPFFRKAFLNMIISDFRLDKRQELIKQELLARTASTRYRYNVERGHPLDAFANYMEQQRVRADLDSVRVVLKKMYETIDRHDGFIFQLYVGCEFRTKEIAEMTQIEEENVRKIILRCKRKFLELWKRIETRDRNTNGSRK